LKCLGPGGYINFSSLHPNAGRELARLWSSYLKAIERREALIDNAMVKLIARGHRWHRKLFDGTHASIEDLAKSENISPSFVSRILRLAYLSPTLVEAILDGKYPAHLTMKDLMEPFPMDWEGQREHFFSRGSAVQDRS
jgi:hypothetical protein